ncbi:MAG TPA: hypothetical protein VGP64_03440 [Polyangia bacterium]
MVVVTAVASGCGGGKAAGTQDGPCYGNDTCNSGLACLSKLCVNPNGSGGAGGAVGAAGAGGAVGVAGTAGAVGVAGAGGGAGAGGTAGAGGIQGTGGGTAGAGACSGLSVPAQSCLSTAFTKKINNKIDILFMIDNSSSMLGMQQKLYDQLPTFMNVLESAPTRPDLHIAVVSSDLGAPGDATNSLACTTKGDQGQFQVMPRGTCTDTTLQNGAAFIADDGDGNKNYTSPNIATVLQCIALLGEKGCGFEHQLASIDRALGADGSDPPSTNSDFLRSDAYLGIVILTNEDDCSAPSNTELYSLTTGGSNQQNISNALGPIANYRCNEYGHLCMNTSGNLIMPPLGSPTRATTLDLTACISNDTSTGLLSPVLDYLRDIRALKPDPDNQILVAAIAGPASPYTVTWMPEQNGQNTQPGELWPQIEHSCGPAGGYDVNPEATMNPTDGTFADPGVRITQFVTSFPDSVLASVCDLSYASSMTATATKIGQLIIPPCITQTIQNDANGNPICSIIEHVGNNDVVQSAAIPNCATSGNVAPCWTLVSGTAHCAGRSLTINDTPQNDAAQSAYFTMNCSVCVPNAGQRGCP